MWKRDAVKGMRDQCWVRKKKKRGWNGTASAMAQAVQVLESKNYDTRLVDRAKFPVSVPFVALLSLFPLPDRVIRSSSATPVDGGLVLRPSDSRPSLQSLLHASRRGVSTFLLLMTSLIPRLSSCSRQTVAGCDTCDVWSPKS